MPHATILRYSLIIDKISRKTFPSFSELKDFLFEQGLEISGRTLQRDIEQDVILSFTPLQGKYVKALPMHWSQEIIQENERELIIRLCIIPNLEFIQRVLMLGPNVKVLEPEWVAKEVKDALLEALTQYD